MIIQHNLMGNQKHTNTKQTERETNSEAETKRHRETSTAQTQRAWCSEKSDGERAQHRVKTHSGYYCLIHNQEA